MRVGQGWDLHLLTAGRPLILGGLPIPADSGCLAHSDGDVLIHALIDALLGALALGDIGDHFPPSDPRYRDISSVILLKQVMEEVRDRGYGVVNVDCTVILESPRLTGYKAAIARNLEALLGLAAGTVSVKAKTAEGTGPVGAGKAAEAKAVVLLDRS